MSAALLPWLVAALAGVGWLRSGLRARVRSELIARACHEVRGPLTAALLALHAAAHPRPGAPASIAGVQREIDRAAAAVDEVAAAGRGRRLRDRLEPVDVHDLLAVQAATWRPVARTLGTDLHVRRGEGDLTVRADRGRLVQATANLIANAIEHGGGRVTLAAVPRGDRVEIEVADEGSRDLPQVIGAPRPGSSRGRGLAIVADIAARHGGRLVARTSPRGTRMAVELPRREGRA